MRNSVLISVIVAVYQAESYLNRCLDSILNQTFTSFEVLLIDDGSTDDSGTICDKYAQKDDRVRVFHKKNEGRSATRQFGIDNSRGVYTIHIDPDDWVEPNMLELLYAKAESCSADIVMFDVLLELEEGKQIYVKQEVDDLNSNNLLSLIYDPLYASLCNKLIKRDCFVRYSIRFAADMEFAEDLYVMLQLLNHSIHVEYIPYGLYHYDRYSNTGSITRSLSLEDIIQSIEYMQANLDNRAEVALRKLKRDALVIAYFKNGIDKSSICNLYREVDSELLLSGLRHPIEHWKRLVVGLQRYHLSWLGYIYSSFIMKAVEFKSYLRNQKKT